MSLFAPKKKTDKDLQAELKALCNRIIGEQLVWRGDWDRYERLLKEIYERNLEPEAKIRPVKRQTDTPPHL